ncbi:MAG: MBL fold metallo-hydrolase [Bacteroidota bacterium]|nr:MBL fold metallo-hydrolase [Bacteroidota bacterium]
MKITIWGVRGSIPASGPDTIYYGGNTSCVEVEKDGWLLVLDAGTGIQRLPVNTDSANKRIDILLTHLHMDHIQGLGFFKPLFDPSMEVHIWGPAGSKHSLRSRLGRYFSPPLFPVHFRDLPVSLTLHEIDNSFFEIGPFSVQSEYVIHSGPTIGYRIDDHHSVFAYLPDHEPALGRTGMINDIKWVSGGNLASGADLLLHDAQYTSEEYRQRIGWGHSCIEDAAKFASLAQVKHLLFSHYDPSHTDARIKEIFDGFQKKYRFPFKYEMATEGMKIDL